MDDQGFLLADQARVTGVSSDKSMVEFLQAQAETRDRPAVVKGIPLVKTWVRIFFSGHPGTPWIEVVDEGWPGGWFMYQTHDGVRHIISAQAVLSVETYRGPEPPSADPVPCAHPIPGTNVCLDG